MLKIGVGSASKHKVNAVAKACVVCGITDYDLLSFKTTLDMPEQPVGMIETVEGARLRARQVLEKTKVDIVIGIESGVIQISKNSLDMIDLAAVVIARHGLPDIITTSVGILFKEEFVTEAMQKGFNTTTVGSVIANKLGGSDTDPHYTVTNKKITRSELLVQAVVAALVQI